MPCTLTMLTTLPTGNNSLQKRHHTSWLGVAIVQLHCCPPVKPQVIDSNCAKVEEL